MTMHERTGTRSHMTMHKCMGTRSSRRHMPRGTHWLSWVLLVYVEHLKRALHLNKTDPPLWNQTKDAAPLVWKWQLAVYRDPGSRISRVGLRAGGVIMWCLLTHLPTSLNFSSPLIPLLLLGINSEGWWQVTVALLVQGIRETELESSNWKDFPRHHDFP